MWRYIVLFGLLASVALCNSDGCKGAQNGKKIQDSADCRSYIQCHNGRSFNKMCWVGTRFDEEKQNCVKGICPICNCSPDASSPVPPTDEACQGQRNKYKFQDPEDCRGYIICDNGKAKRYLCAARKKFDETKRMCVKGNCPICNCPKISSTVSPSTSTSTPVPVQTSTTKPSSDKEESNPSKETLDCKGMTDGSAKRDPKNCGKFWVCIYDTPIERQCPEGLWYDEERLVCNYPQEVKCPAGKY